MSRTAQWTALLLAALTTVGYGQVRFSRLTTGLTDAGEWLTYSGSYDSRRHSPLAEITASNVARLRPVWAYQADGGMLEATPLVADGVLFLSEPPASVVALSLKSGRPLWRWKHPLDSQIRTIGFGPTNRGVALLDQNLYVGTLDGRLVALDSRTGTQRWDVSVADNAVGYSITAAPLAVDGKIIVGVSGGEAGVRGFLDTYDATNGKRLWRFWTVPEPGQAGSETWSNDGWQHGGGATWLTGSYDPATRLLYWGTGNPGPWNGDVRPGDNLYTCSLLALDVDTGKLRWHFQFTPHDVHDWDANQIPVLVDAQLGGRTRSLVVTANRNGFFYALDRTTGEFLNAAPFAKQTWARGIDAHGRPDVLPESMPTESGVLVYPSLQGAANWASPAYSAATGLFYVSVREMGSVYNKTQVEYRAGTYYTGTSERAREEEATGAVRAINVKDGTVAWSFPLPTPPWAGVLSTAGGLVFGGSNEGNVFALDAASGKPLWQFQTGAGIAAAPMSFLFEGHQYIAVSANRTLFVFALDKT